MPLGWAWVRCDTPGSDPQPAARAPQSPTLPNGITIHSGSLHASAEGGLHYSIPDAEISYGETTVRADLIEVYPAGGNGFRPGSGVAHGHVKVIDPIGTISAAEGRFNWNDHTGEASDAVISSEGLEISASHVDIKPGVWTLTGIKGEFSRGRPLGYVLADTIILRPGRGLVAYRIDGHLLGTRIGGLHRFTYSAVGHLGGDRFPVPTISGDRGVGVRYSPKYLVDDRTAIAGSFVANQAAAPSYGIEVARSFLPPGEAKGLVVPRFDLDMRFDFGYFDSLGVESPTDEHERIGQNRNNVMADVEYNVQAYDRKGNEVFAKPFESIYERSFSSGGFSVLTDSTLQQIHSLGGSDHDRFLNATSVALPVIRLAPTLTSRIRIDGAAFLGGSDAFDWVHAQFGFVYRPNDMARLGAAYVAAHQYGTPLYLADELYSQDGLDLRGDYQIGPHRLSLLAKFDLDRDRWYDREILLGQVVGPFEVFARLRTFPSQFVLGVQLRADSVINQLLKKNPGRPKPTPKLVD